MTAISKRVVFTMGGKGGVGKTGVMVALAEWFQANEIPVTLLDLDTENKARGSLKHFFNGTVTKVNIHTPAGLDAFVDHLDGGTSDHPCRHGSRCRAGCRRLVRVDVRGCRCDRCPLHCGWRSDTGPGQRRKRPGLGESATGSGRVRRRRERNQRAGGFHVLAVYEQANRFREAFSPEILQMEFRLAELENPVRQHGIQLGQVADRKTDVDELKRASLVMRAQSYRRRLFSEFDRARQVFLP